MTLMVGLAADAPMPELIVAPAARADLLAQWDYFADEVGNPDLADRFFARAQLTFKSLARTPGLGRPRKFRSPKAQNLRSWKVEDFSKHLVFYRALPKKLFASFMARGIWKRCSTNRNDLPSTRFFAQNRVRGLAINVLLRALSIQAAPNFRDAEDSGMCLACCRRLAGKNRVLILSPTDSLRD